MSGRKNAKVLRTLSSNSMLWTFSSLKKSRLLSVRLLSFSAPEYIHFIILYHSEINIIKYIEPIWVCYDNDDRYVILVHIPIVLASSTKLSNCSRLLEWLQDASKDSYLTLNSKEPM